MPQPMLVRQDGMPFRHFTGMEKEVDGGRRRARARIFSAQKLLRNLYGGLPNFLEPAAFDMALQSKQFYKG
ncbi:hypothetical protein D3C71_1709460 [compost metagenome]